MSVTDFAKTTGKKCQRNVQSSGEPFTDAQIKAVWEKSQKIFESHPLLHLLSKTVSSKIKSGSYILDSYGHMVSFDKFGEASDYGWEIDHICPINSKKSSSKNDDIENLRVLHWQSNEKKGQLDARIYELEYEYIILNKAS